MDDLRKDLPEVAIKQEQIEIICNYNYALHEESEYWDNADNPASDEETSNTEY